MDDDPIEEEQEEGAPEWALTFGDMMSLLLCFFILLLSFANMDIEKFREVTQSLTLGFGDPSGLIVSKSQFFKREEFSNAEVAFSASEVETEATSRVGSEQEAMGGGMGAWLEAAGMGEEVAVRQGESEVRVISKESFLFGKGSSGMNSEAQEFVDKLAGLLKDTSTLIRIEGHTDDLAGRNKSNFLLSAERAVMFADELISRGIDKHRLEVVGHGANKPLATNDTEEGRNKNRRVELVLTEEPAEENLEFSVFEEEDNQELLSKAEEALKAEQALKAKENDEENLEKKSVEEVIEEASKKKDGKKTLSQVFEGKKEFYNQIVKKITKMSKTNPTPEIASINLGLYFIKKGEFEKAIEKFHLVLKQNPKNFEAPFFLGFLYENYISNKTQAVKCYEIAQKIQKESPDGEKLSAWIKSLKNEISEEERKRRLAEAGIKEGQSIIKFK